MSEPLDCQINNTIAVVFREHIERHKGMIIGAGALQDRLVTALVKTVQRMYKEDKEPSGRQRHSITTIERQRVTCAECGRAFSGGYLRHPGDRLSGWNCPRHKCRGGKMQVTVGLYPRAGESE